MSKIEDSIFHMDNKFSKYSVSDIFRKFSRYSAPEIFRKFSRYCNSDKSGKCNKYRHMAGTVVFTVACGFILYGAVRGEAFVVLNKAVNICLECIGLG